MQINELRIPGIDVLKMAHFSQDVEVQGKDFDDSLGVNEYYDIPSNFRFTWKRMRQNGQHAIYRYHNFDVTQLERSEDVSVVDPRPRTARLIRRDHLELSVPVFEHDSNSVGPPRINEVTFSNLNDNVNEPFLREMCEKYGVLTNYEVFYHARTKKHLGIAKAIFSTCQAAERCVMNLNNIKKFGHVISVALDYNGEERARLIRAAMSDPVNSAPFRPPSPKSILPLNIMDPIVERKDSGTSSRRDSKTDHRHKSSKDHRRVDRTSAVRSSVEERDEKRASSNNSHGTMRQVSAPGVNSHVKSGASVNNRIERKFDESHGDGASLYDLSNENNNSKYSAAPRNCLQVLPGMSYERSQSMFESGLETRNKGNTDNRVVDTSLEKSSYPNIDFSSVAQNQYLYPPLPNEPIGENITRETWNSPENQSNVINSSVGNGSNRYIESIKSFESSYDPATSLSRFNSLEGDYLPQANCNLESGGFSAEQSALVSQSTESNPAEDLNSRDAFRYNDLDGEYSDYEESKGRHHDKLRHKHKSSRHRNHGKSREKHRSRSKERDYESSTNDTPNAVERIPSRVFIDEQNTSPVASFEEELKRYKTQQKVSHDKKSKHRDRHRDSDRSRYRHREHRTRNKSSERTDKYNSPSFTHSDGKRKERNAEYDVRPEKSSHMFSGDDDAGDDDEMIRDDQYMSLDTRIQALLGPVLTSPPVIESIEPPLPPVLPPPSLPEPPPAFMPPLPPEEPPPPMWPDTGGTGDSNTIFKDWREESDVNISNGSFNNWMEGEMGAWNGIFPPANDVVSQVIMAESGLFPGAYVPVNNERKVSHVPDLMSMSFDRPVNNTQYSVDKSAELLVKPYLNSISTALRERRGLGGDSAGGDGKTGDTNRAYHGDEMGTNRGYHDSYQQSGDQSMFTGRSSQRESFDPMKKLREEVSTEVTKLLCRELKIVLNKDLKRKLIEETGYKRVEAWFKKNEEAEKLQDRTNLFRAALLPSSQAPAPGNKLVAESSRPGEIKSTADSNQSLEAKGIGSQYTALLDSTNLMEGGGLLGLRGAGMRRPMANMPSFKRQRKDSERTPSPVRQEKDKSSSHPVMKPSPWKHTTNVSAAYSSSDDDDDDDDYEADDDVDDVSDDNDTKKKKFVGPHTPEGSDNDESLEDEEDERKSVVSTPLVKSRKTVSDVWGDEDSDSRGSDISSDSVEHMIKSRGKGPRVAVYTSDEDSDDSDDSLWNSKTPAAVTSTKLPPLLSDSSSSQEEEARAEVPVKRPISKVKQQQKSKQVTSKSVTKRPVVTSSKFKSAEIIEESSSEESDPSSYEEKEVQSLAKDKQSSSDQLGKPVKPINGKPAEATKPLKRAREEDKDLLSMMSPKKKVLRMAQLDSLEEEEQKSAANNEKPTPAEEEMMESSDDADVESKKIEPKKIEPRKRGSVSRKSVRTSVEDDSEEGGEAVRESEPRAVVTFEPNSVVSADEELRRKEEDVLMTLAGLCYSRTQHQQQLQQQQQQQQQHEYKLQQQHKLQQQQQSYKERQRQEAMRQEEEERTRMCEELELIGRDHCYDVLPLPQIYLHKSKKASRGRPRKRHDTMTQYDESDDEGTMSLTDSVIGLLPALTDLMAHDHTYCSLYQPVPDPLGDLSFLPTDESDYEDEIYPTRVVNNVMEWLEHVPNICTEVVIDETTDEQEQMDEEIAYSDQEEIYEEPKKKSGRLCRELANLLPAVVPPPKPKFIKRSEDTEAEILRDILVSGVDDEDLFYLQKGFERLAQENRDNTSHWACEINWVNHPVTYLPDDQRYRESSNWWFGGSVRYSKRRSKHDWVDDMGYSSRLRAGCARCEGYSKQLHEDKKKNRSKHVQSSRGGMMGCTQQSSPSKAAGAVELDVEESKTLLESLEQQARKGQQQTRDARSESRRLQTAISTSLGDECVGELLRFNQLKFRRKQLKFGRSSIHDWGLFAIEPVQGGEMIIEYVGQVVRQSVADVRECRYEARGIGSSYLFRVDKEFIVDATLYGNLSRFINHSCNPNCCAKIITVDSVKKIVIYSKQYISPNEEITYDYKFPLEQEKIVCLCGSSGCRGTLN